MFWRQQTLEIVSVDMNSIKKALNLATYSLRNELELVTYYR